MAKNAIAHIFNCVVPLYHVGSKGADTVLMHLSDNQLGSVCNVIVVVLRLVDGLACSLRYSLVCKVAIVSSVKDNRAGQGYEQLPAKDFEPRSIVNPCSQKL